MNVDEILVVEEQANFWLRDPEYSRGSGIVFPVKWAQQIQEELREEEIGEIERLSTAPKRWFSVNLEYAVRLTRFGLVRTARQLGPLEERFRGREQQVSVLTRLTRQGSALQLLRCEPETSFRTLGETRLILRAFWASLKALPIPPRQFSQRAAQHLVREGLARAQQEGVSLTPTGQVVALRRLLS
jgi:hypothetical protein